MIKITKYPSSTRLNFENYSLFNEKLVSTDVNTFTEWVKLTDNDFLLIKNIPEP